MAFYTTVAIIVCIIVIAWIIYQFYKDNLSNGSFLLWLIVWVAIMLFAIFPQLSTIFARIFGLGRGLDALYILAFVILLYVIFRLYNTVDKQTKRINNLVSQLAIREEEEENNSYEDDDD